LKWVSFLLVFTLFLSIAPLTANASIKIDAGDLLKIILDEATKDSKSKEPPAQSDSMPQAQNNDVAETKTGAGAVYPEILTVIPKNWDTDTAIYSAPSAKSKVLFEWWDFQEVYAEVTPVIDKGDNSKWYKIIFVENYADFLRQVHKLAEFNYSYGYVNANDVEIHSLSDYAKEEIIWIYAGRPPREKVGDDFREKAGDRSIRTLKVPVTLLKEPKDGAEKIKIPAGLKYVSYAVDTEDMFPVYYNDMDEVDWALIVRADTYKVLGWIKAEEWGNIPWEKK
jgi:L-rhamnose mutarotase